MAQRAFRVRSSEGKIAGRKVYLLKPMTYMNDSGDIGWRGDALFQAAAFGAGRDP